MEHREQSTVTSFKSNLFVIITLCTAVCLIIIITVFLLTTVKARQSTSQTATFQPLQIRQAIQTTTTLSPEEVKRLSLFKEFLNLPSNHPNPNPSHTMNHFMRSVYRDISNGKNARRKTRQRSNFYLSDETDFVISLPNQSPHRAPIMTYHFDYQASLQYLTYAELILPLPRISTIEISSSTFNLSFKHPIQNDSKWVKIDLTPYVTAFPLTFHLTLLDTEGKRAALSSGFLTLYFRRPTHLIARRDLSLFHDNQLVTYPNEPCYCQVRRLRTSFSELNWSSWILEPRSYEMNVCSGSCRTQSNMGTYFIIQNLLNQKYPKQIPAPCCKPKRFSSTILLYYDGSNLVLKRHENMRVVECGCSS